MSGLQREDLLLGVDRGRLHEPKYFEGIKGQLEGLTRMDERAIAQWFLLPHTHRCPRCQRVLEHTGLAAVRDGNGLGEAAHLCCGVDVRTPKES